LRVTGAHDKLCYLRRGQLGRQIAGQRIHGCSRGESAGRRFVHCSRFRRRHRLHRPHAARPGQPPGQVEELRGVPAGVWRPLAAESAVLLGRAILRWRWSRGGRRQGRKRRCQGHDRAAGRPGATRAAGLEPGLARGFARVRGLRQRRGARGGLLQPGRAADSDAGLGVHRGPGDLPPGLDPGRDGSLRPQRADGIEAGTTLRRPADHAPEPDVPARLPAPYRLRRMQHRRTRWCGTDGLRSDRVAGASHRPVCARRGRRHRLHLPAAARARPGRGAERADGDRAVLPQPPPAAAGGPAGGMGFLRRCTDRSARACLSQ
jgi:hypothetical protein